MFNIFKHHAEYCFCLTVFGDIWFCGIWRVNVSVVCFNGQRNYGSSEEIEHPLHVHFLSVWSMPQTARTSCKPCHPSTQMMVAN